MTTIGGRHLLVTGGASGIGKLVVRKATGLGATVTILDVDEAAMARLVDSLTAAGSDARGYVCDVGDRAAVADVAHRVLADAGPVDILVNNAGVVSGRPLLELTDEQIERTLRVNTLALFWVTRAFLPAMIGRGGGHVVTVSSAGGLIGTPRMSDYAASKFAAFGFSESLRNELRRSAPGVKTTIVCPFYIDTGMFAGVRTRFSFLLPILKEEDVAERIVDAIQTNKAQVLMPPLVNMVAPLRALPVPLFDLVADVLGVNAAMDHFEGRAGTQPGARAGAHSSDSPGKETP